MPVTLCKIIASNLHSNMDKALQKGKVDKDRVVEATLSTLKEDNNFKRHVLSIPRSSIAMLLKCAPYSGLIEQFKSLASQIEEYESSVGRGMAYSSLI